MSGPATQRTAGEAEVGRLRTLYRLLEALSRASAIEDVYNAALASLLNATDAEPRRDSSFRRRWRDPFQGIAGPFR